VLGVRWHDVPPAVRRRLAFLLRDFAAVVVAGRRTETAVIAADHAAAESPGDAATAFLDGRPLGCTGAAFANGVLANALDYDDGHRLVKGHPGANVIPAAVAVAEATEAPLEELLAAIAVGYEVAIRAGISLHRREDSYHASGAWGGLGAAAACARLLGLDAERVGHVLGLAEYHAPMAPIMRSVAAPAMTKDACSWGALVGTTSALLASRGFTAVESAFAREAHADLGERWHLLDVYVKPYPCCRWTQPAVEAALSLAASNGIDPAAIERVEIRSFGVFAGLAHGVPRTTEEAQYSLGWPVAVALAHRRFGVDDVLGAALADTAAGELSARAVAVVEPELERQFPARRLAALRVAAGGRTLETGPFEAPGEPDDPRWEAIVAAKFERHAGPTLGVCPRSEGRERVGGRDADGLLRLLAGVAEEPS
jgi:2-methylcitrate dehydratase PrpD